MLRALIIFSFLFLNLYALEPTVKELSWPNGSHFLNFLENNKIPLSLYYNLSSEDQELAAEIIAGTKYQILKDNDGNTLQVLIPVSDELQMHTDLLSKRRQGAKPQGRKIGLGRHIRLHGLRHPGTWL